MTKSHYDDVLRVLKTQISSPEEVKDIGRTAAEVARSWVNPLGGGAKEETNGLIYGLIQSGKTGVLTVTGALGADEGYRTIIILTSDIDPLYEQTLGRIREAFPAIGILGKNDLKDYKRFLFRVKSGTCAIVVTKNSKVLGTMIDNFMKGNVPGLTCLIIDDEADQASLNTKARKADGTRSAINERVTKLRGFFQKSTYIQVTATPQALFLQSPGHDFRPKFTVLSEPGAGYVGGEDFFGDGSRLVKEFDLKDIDDLAPGSQPTPGRKIPLSLLEALDTFMIGATFKHMGDASQNCAFLCHVSTRTSDHSHIVDLLWKYASDLATGAKDKSSAVVTRLKAAYDDLSETHPGFRNCNFNELVDEIAWCSPGINVKLVNGETDEDVAVHSPCNLFVGGNKLGRGVTIKNLLVSYYGRNPKSPQADTVLQHARMYGYRKVDLGLLRLFLPRELHKVFRAIHRMERGLRELIVDQPNEEFRGVFIETGLSPTRRNVLAPGAVGVYTGGCSYNPAQVVRDESIVDATARIDALVASRRDKEYVEAPLDELIEILKCCVPSAADSEKIWDLDAVAGSITQYGKLFKQTSGYLWLDRGRGLRGPRRETQGILDSGDDKNIPRDKVALFLLRVQSTPKDSPAWWPQIRFPQGRYGFAFAI